MLLVAVLLEEFVQLFQPEVFTQHHVMSQPTDIQQHRLPFSTYQLSSIQQPYWKVEKEEEVDKWNQHWIWNWNNWISY
jgi:hypothetical protein